MHVMSVFNSSNTHIHLFLGDGVMDACALHTAIESDLLQRRREDELGIINENSADFIGFLALKNAFSREVEMNVPIAAYAKPSKEAPY